MKKLFFLFVACLFSIASQAKSFNQDDSTFTSSTELVGRYDALTNSIIVDQIHSTEKIIRTLDTVKTESFAIVHSGNSKKFEMHPYIAFQIAKLKEGYLDTIEFEKLDLKQWGFKKTWIDSRLCALKKGNTVYLSTIDNSMTAPIDGSWGVSILFLFIFFINLNYFLIHYKEAYKEGKVNVKDSSVDFVMFVLYFFLVLCIFGNELHLNLPIIIPFLSMLILGVILRLGLFFPKLIHKLNKDKTIEETEI